jgi:hypothetical protein
MSIGTHLARSLIDDLGRLCGLAAKIAKALRTRPDDLVTVETFFSFEFPVARIASVEPIMDDFIQRGWARRDIGGWRSVGRSIPEDVPAFLSGAGMMAEFGPKDVIVQPVVTFPLAPSRIGPALEATGLAQARIVQTDQALTTIAGRAANRFAIMTPYLNPEGMEMVMSLLRTTTAPSRTLIVRDWPKVEPFVMAHLKELTALQVKLVDYKIDYDDGSYETFHAKICLADSDLAYVGSANMTVYTRRSMECGFMVEGIQATRPVADLIEAVVASGKICP